MKNVKEIKKPRYLYQVDITTGFNVRAFLHKGTTLLSGGGVETKDVYYSVLGRTLIVKCQIDKDLSNPIEYFLN